MAVAVLCASHTPLKGYADVAPEIAQEVDGELDRLRTRAAGFAPTRVIVVGPDHFNGFFYRMMPCFCLGAAAVSVGDWNTPAGALPCDAALAEAATATLHATGVDAALSYDMHVDHGITQILAQLFEWQALPPVLPIFVNCAAPPRPPLHRVIAFGEALGHWLAALPGRTLLIASGGLSHDPPIPTLADAPPPVRERLIAGGRLDPDARAARQQRVLDDAAAQVGGESPRTPLNPAWDQGFLERLSACDWDAIAAMDDATITREGGCGGHEIRTWLAVVAAARAAGLAAPQTLYYRAIPQWVAGYGLMWGDAAA